MGAIPVHLACGIWGTLAVCLTNPEADLIAQLTGIVAIGAFAVITSLAVWYGLKLTMGIRMKANEEEIGGDLAEIGMRAYNIEEDNVNKKAA